MSDSAIRIGLLSSAASLAVSLFAPGIAQAGAFIFAGEIDGVDVVAHPVNWTAAGGSVTVKVCQGGGDGNGPSTVIWRQSVENMIDVYNQMLPTIGNLRYHVLDGGMDFESVAIHELGHCIGKAHVNAASESDLVGANREYTKATNGADNTFNLDDGVDNVIGSGDDVRGDDVNLHWFRSANNNPFTMDYSGVDTTNYARDTGSLPGTDTFAANAGRDVATLMSTPSTEAIMQQGSGFEEIQRTLSHDDVATLLLARSGVDGTRGTSDDYTVALEFSESTADCDVNLSFDDSLTGFAVCWTGASISGNHAGLTSANAYFNSGYNWSFNTADPCFQSANLLQDTWHMISLPCQVVDPDKNTVADIIGDDLLGTQGTDWAIFERDAGNDSYTQLASTDVMETGRGYFLRTKLEDQSFTVEGQFPGSPDIPLVGAPGGRWNLVGHPLDFPVDWAEVQVVDDSASLGVVKSISSVDSSTEMLKSYQVWNGVDYDTYNDGTPGMEGTLQHGQAIWMKVIGDGLRLRVTATPPAGTLSAPSGLTAVMEPSFATLNWNNDGGGTAYHVQRWDRSGNSCSTDNSSRVLAWVTSDNSTYMDSDFGGSPAADGYCYRVRSCWGGEAYPRVNGCSSWTSLARTTEIGSASSSDFWEEIPVVTAVSSAGAPVESSPQGASPEAARPVIEKARKPRADGKEIGEDGGWFVRIIAESGQKQSRGTVFGQLPDADDGLDEHDLEKLQPFGSTYLSVVFPREDREHDAWGYASDFRALTARPGGEWVFAIHASEETGPVTVRFEGPATILKHSRIWQGQESKGRPVARRGGSFTFTPDPGPNYFTVKMKRGKK